MRRLFLSEEPPCGPAQEWNDRSWVFDESHPVGPYEHDPIAEFVRHANQLGSIVGISTQQASAKLAKALSSLVGATVHADPAGGSPWSIYVTYEHDPCGRPVPECGHADIISVAPSAKPMLGPLTLREHSLQLRKDRNTGPNKGGFDRRGKKRN